MPSAPLRPCGPGCSELVTRGKCEKHRIRTEADNRERRGKTSERGYGWKWQQRAYRFKMRFPYCGMRPDDKPPVMSKCWEEGIVTLAKQVDHVVPHRNNPALMWDEKGNWQSLCARCGAAKSARGL